MDTQHCRIRAKKIIKHGLLYILVNTIVMAAAFILAFIVGGYAEHMFSASTYGVLVMAIFGALIWNLIPFILIATVIKLAIKNNSCLTYATGGALCSSSLILLAMLDASFSLILMLVVPIMGAVGGLIYRELEKHFIPFTDRENIL